ncbi:MAG: aminopeptidase P family protein [Alphaproteobacteria bacterium]|nr:aminopeptidase P family protein [Alphaproteobacteria bacterium]
MPGFLDRRRAGRLMREEGLEALVLAQPESITYAAGAFPGVASFWRRAGAAFLLVPADEHQPLTAIVGDLQAKSFREASGIDDVRSHRIWVETDSHPMADAAKPKRMPRPAQYELTAALALLRDALGDRHLARTRVGLELGFVPVADFHAFQSIDVTWADCTRLVERLRAVKQPAEIKFLRDAACFAAAGMEVLIASIAPGMTAEQMTAIWREAAISEAARRAERPPQSTWAYIAVGGDGFAPGGPTQAGDLIKIDVGCVVGGYSSDGGRTASLGTPHPAASQMFDALHRAFDAGLAVLRPGVPLQEVYRETAGTMWKQGYDTYGRGHFGHGVGSSIWSEEWPFISAASDAIAEPGMVLAFETPHYVRGLGGFIIEDQILITDGGIEIMAPMPRELRVITHPSP